MSDAHPVYLVLQGQLKAGGEEDYARYLEGTRPLMQEYGCRVAAVGPGIASHHTTSAWPINGVLEFPSREAAERFLTDPRYLEIKTRFRDQAYETLHLSLFQGRPPRT